MANLASAKKNLRKSKKRRERNRYTFEKIKDLLKAKDADVKLTQSLIDKAVKVGLFKKNKASRLKAKLYRQKNVQ